MNTCCVPIVMPTLFATQAASPWWSRFVALLAPQRLQAWLATPTPPPLQSLRESDLLPLQGLSDALQADIGVPMSLRSAAQALRERDAWRMYF